MLGCLKLASSLEVVCKVMPAPKGSVYSIAFLHCKVRVLNKLQHLASTWSFDSFRKLSSSGHTHQENYNLARDLIQPVVYQNGDKPFLIFTDGVNASNRHVVSYKQLFDASVNLATALREVGGSAGPPKLALVVLPKVLPWWVINVAASWCGSTVAPGPSLLTGANVAYRLTTCGADCVFCPPHLTSSVDAALAASPATCPPLLKVVVGEEESSPGWHRYSDLLSLGARLPSMPCHSSSGDDVCQLFFTSGTTGRPKMVPHTHRAFALGLQVMARRWLDLGPEDILWNISDTGWAKAAWSSLYAPAIAGATAFVHQMERFDPELVLRALHEEDVSVLCAPPTAYRALVQLPLHRYPFRALRHCVSAGEPLNPEVIHAWTSQTGVSVYEGYGQTETTLLCATFRGMEVKPGSMGKPTPEYVIKVVDEQLGEVAVGEVGQIAVQTSPQRPLGLFKGYRADEKKTQEAFKGNYYLTGDRAYQDADGYLWFVARNDDVITSSGYRIGPFEVESALLEHKSVVEAAAVGVPDALRGHIVKAFVILSKEAAATTKTEEQKQCLVKELQRHVRTVTAPYMYPRQIEFVESLPKTISGKIRRIELRRREEEKLRSGSGGSADNVG